MCEYSGRLVAWIDGELPDQEATNVVRHVGQCAECRRAIGGYQEVSGAFLACYEAALPVPRNRPSWRWVAVAGGIAAAAILLSVVFVSRGADQLPFHPLFAAQAPAIAFEQAAVQVVAIRSRRAQAPKPVRPSWVAVEPTVHVVLPADALFPPGAVPQGFSFIADIHP
jgi:hypothetical protein